MNEKPHRLRFLLLGIVIGSSVAGSLAWWNWSVAQDDVSVQFGQFRERLERSEGLERRAIEILSSGQDAITELRRLVNLYFPAK